MAHVAWRVLKTAIVQWNTHRSPRLGAALAYYSVFSMGPLLLLVIAIAGLFFGEDSVRGSLSAELAGLIGPSGRDALNAMLAGAALRSTSRIAIVVGIALVLMAAVGIVAQLKDSLNTIWNVADPKTASVWWYLRTYLVSLAGVLVLGLLLAVSLVFSTALTALAVWAGGAASETAFWQGLDFLVSFGLLTLLFAMLFKWFPDTEVAWRDVWFGAVVTALLFHIGKLLIGWYVGVARFDLTYGTAASLIVLLIWVYYSAQILLFGAELTHAYASETGSRKRQGPDSATPNKGDAAS